MTVEYTLLALAVPALLAAAGFAVWTHLRTRRMLDTLGKMLDDAIRGEFRESLYDESRLSALETRMAHYLSASAVSAKNLAEEKDAIKTLIGDISHQTKTPIANLLLYSELLLEDDTDNLSVQMRENIVQIHAQSEKLQFLIASLVKLSRLENGILQLSPQEEALKSMLTLAVKETEFKARAKGLELILHDTDEKAYFDSKWTLEAICNILDNALKYTNEGTISLSVTAYEMFVRIDIKDSGIGIKEEELPKIFSRFYRSEDTKNMEGVGIGLYLSRQILSEEGGYIKVSSVYGQGSTFSVFLPKSA